VSPSSANYSLRDPEEEEGAMERPFNITVDKEIEDAEIRKTMDNVQASKRTQKVRFMEEITRRGGKREKEMVEIEQSLREKRHNSPLFHIDATIVKSPKITPATRSTYPHLIRRSYLRQEDIQSLAGEQKLEILCEDGRHYHINFTRRRSSIVLHFPHWNKRFDIVTDDHSIMEYFLAIRGVYSMDDDGKHIIDTGRSNQSSPIPPYSPPAVEELYKSQSLETPIKRANPARSRKRKTELTPDRAPRGDPPPPKQILDESDSTNKDSIVRLLQEPRTPRQRLESDTISPQCLPIGWVGESIRLVCLDCSSLNPAAQKYTGLIRNLSRGELDITMHQRRIGQIETEIDLLKSTDTSHVQIASISSLSSSTPSPSRTGRLLLQYHEFEETNSTRSSRQTSSSASAITLTRLLEEKITRLEKVESIRKEQRVLLHHKEATLRYLTGSVMDLMKHHVDEEIEKFLLDREENER
jgi:hypothetical protein